MAWKTRRVWAFSLAELLMAMTIFAIIITFSFVYLERTKRLWNRVESSASAGQNLHKVVSRLYKDLYNVGKSGVGTKANGTGDAKMGDALWMLSAIDSVKGEFIRSDGGKPLWQRNILYYLTVPQDHDSRYGVHCAHWARYCPHKIMIRKVIDSGPPTTPTSGAGEVEELIAPADIDQFLTRPIDLDLSFPGEVSFGLESTEFVAASLLDLRVTLSGVSLVDEVVVDVEAPLLAESSKRISIGSQKFPEQGMTLIRRAAVIPVN